MVARMARKASAHTVEGLVLGREHDGETTKIAEGQALVDSALRQETVQGTSPIRKATRRLAYKKGSGGKKKHK
jgi:hypothetical protein